MIPESHTKLPKTYPLTFGILPPSYIILMGVPPGVQVNFFNTFKTSWKFLAHYGLLYCLMSNNTIKYFIDFSAVALFRINYDNI